VLLHSYNKMHQRLARFVADPVSLDNDATGRAIRRTRRRPHESRRLEIAQRHRGRVTALLDRRELHGVAPTAYMRAAVLAADRGELVLPWIFALAAK
jgi:hypothetical protein